MHFSKDIFTGGENRTFYFNPTLYSTPNKYNVTFFNSDNGKIETFSLLKDEDGQWKIAAQILPIWVHEIELELNDAIEENDELMKSK